MIGQENQVQSVAATLRRIFATAAFRTPGRSPAAPSSRLNQRPFVSRVRVAATRPGSAWWPGQRSQPQQGVQACATADEVPSVIREPESGWWALQEEPDESIVTVAVVGESQTPGDTEAVVSRLAELAVHDELLVVYGSGTFSKPGHRAVTAGLRSRLPRHDVVALHVDPRSGGLRRDAAVALERFLDEGSLPIVVTPAASVSNLTAEISSQLRADRVLQVSRTSTGADLHQVWCRQMVTNAG